jgi:hypothetical protein
MCRHLQAAPRLRRDHDCARSLGLCDARVQRVQLAAAPDHVLRMCPNMRSALCGCAAQAACKCLHWLKPKGKSEEARALGF